MAAVHAYDACDESIADIDAVFDAYQVSAPNDVLNYLRDHAGLCPVLAAAPEHVKRAYGRRLPLRLCVFRDRDDPSYAQLLVEIVTGRAGKAAWAEADAALRQLHEAWLVSLPRSVTRGILFVAEPS